MSRPTIVIPARAGSKGFPRKNLKLFDHTARIIPDEHRKSVIVTTDDPGVAGMAETYGFKVHERDPALAQDDTDIKTTLKDVLKQDTIEPADTVIMVLDISGQNMGRRVVYVQQFCI
jgi:CMP-N-acetylneuraminic acid synthetase